MKSRLSVAFGAGLLATVALGQSAPWIERADLQLALDQAVIPVPTSAERLARAEALIVADFDLTWEPANNRWRLDVDPWTTLNGWQDDPPLCDPTDPFYEQPTTGATVGQPTIRGCSGFLVGPNLVVSAGHCIGPPPSMDRGKRRPPIPAPIVTSSSTSRTSGRWGPRRTSTCSPIRSWRARWSGSTRA